VVDGAGVAALTDPQSGLGEATVVVPDSGFPVGADTGYKGMDGAGVSVADPAEGFGDAVPT
jgi:hypothetical protein